MGTRRARRPQRAADAPRHGDRLRGVRQGIRRRPRRDAAARSRLPARLRELGGDLRAFGPQPDGSAWRFGIQHPRRAGQTIASLEVAQGGLATSGDYERYFEIDGVRYCHILDPRTGWPVRYWQSVTVLALLAIAAGSLSTISMLGQAAAGEFLAQSGAAWLTVGPSGEVASSGGPAGDPFPGMVGYSTRFGDIRLPAIAEGQGTEKDEDPRDLKGEPARSPPSRAMRCSARRWPCWFRSPACWWRAA
ncbi:MAG: FAD:protein FMN transferase [Burkholderiaceae bacterium]